jgi:two-component system, LytTR family, response regulator LytT
MKGKSINILIIEDELHAAKRLQKLISETTFETHVLQHCESIEASLAYLKAEPNIDLIFMDIRLGDGISLSLFEQIKITAPVIFTTAYDEYMLKAFKVNSIDYLLKPIDALELENAIQKYESLYQKNELPQIDLSSLFSILNPPKFKERYLVKSGTQMIIVPVEEIQYFYTEDGYSFIMSIQGKKHIIDQTLDNIQKEINPKEFFRINRAMLLRATSIVKVEQYFNSRFSLELVPKFTDSVIVSREKVKDFKEWLEG